MTPTKAPTRDLHDPVAAARFWDNVLIGEPDECWPWVTAFGTKESTGHIRIWYQGVKIYAHRLSYLLAGGVIDDGEVVRHAICDRGDCMNFLHMRAGTVGENNRDREVRNRRTPYLPRGQAHWSAKLTDQDAERIRTARKLGVAATDLAALFGVSRSSIYNIWAGTHYPPTRLPEDGDH